MWGVNFCGGMDALPGEDRKEGTKHSFEKLVFSTYLFIFVASFINKTAMSTVNTQSEAYRKVHFAVMAIEGSARKQQVTGQEMHRRLKQQDLIHCRLFRHYELLHTQSLEWVVDDTLETLRNWELEGKEDAQ